MIKISYVRKKEKIQFNSFKSPFLEKYKQQRMKNTLDGKDNSEEDDDIDEVIQKDLEFLAKS